MNYLKAGAALATLVALTWCYSVVSSWREDAQLLPIAERAVVNVQNNFNAYRDNTARELSRLKSIEQGYTDEIATLRADRSGLSIIVRQCAATARTTAATIHFAPAAGPDAPIAGTGNIPGEGAADRAESGIDIGPDIEQLARDADEVTAMARGLQAYVGSLPEACMLVPTT